MKNKIIAFFLLAAGLPQGAVAQRLLSLDSCRAMALRNNKQLSISRVKQEVAANVRKSARTKYLPHVSALGGYEWTSKEISLLSDEQKETLSNLGTSLAGGIGGKVNDMMSQVPEGTWKMLNALGITQEGIATNVGQLAAGLGAPLDGLGRGIVDAFHTDTRNMFAGAVMVTQPVFMGGAIIAMNKMADLGEELACNSAEQTRQQTLYSIDQTYWQVVSLRHKQKLAEGYLDLVKKLDDDVQKMIQEGVATRSEGLRRCCSASCAECLYQNKSFWLTKRRKRWKL